MRKDVKKLLFFGLERDKNRFFIEAQKLGLVQFIDRKNRKMAHSSPASETLAHAIKILRSFEKGTQEEIGSPIDAAINIIDLKKKQDKLEEELRILRLEIERIQIFGNFSIADIKFIEEKGGRVCQFFSSKELLDADNLIYITSQAGLHYYLSVSQEPASYSRASEMKIDRSLGELKEAIIRNQEEHHEVHLKLASFSRFSDALHKALFASLDLKDLKFAEEGTESQLEGQVFTSTGFAAEDKVRAVFACAKEFDIHAEEVAIDPSDTVPTCLENKRWGKMGEDLVNIYDTPSSSDKDPSLWVFFSFFIFFSIIIGDGGYGSVFLGLALYLRYKFPNLDQTKKRLLNLFTILCVGCIAWGLLTTSFFGISFSADHFLRQFSLVNYLAEKKGGSEDQVLMEISLFIGGIHILLGMARYLRKNPSNIGWMIFLVGAYLYLPFYLGSPSLLNYLFGIPFEQGAAAGLQMIGFGIPLAIGISVFRNGILGLTEVMNLIQVFADALSYLRLYALALSGAILSATINSMADFLPFVLAVLLIIAGHIVNMILGIMGGVIHGLRLNFIEWYHYSFEGGGKPFKPLKTNSGETV